MSSSVPWEVLSERRLVDNPWLRVFEQRVRLANGVEIEGFHLIDGPEWAAVIAITQQDEVLFVRQYRHGVGEASLELPAGVIERNEDPAVAAARELKEETGFAVRSLEPLLIMNTEPARHTTRAHFFVAHGAYRVAEARPEATELIELQPIPTAQIGAALDAGRIRHGIHIAALLFAARRGVLRID